MYGKFFSTLFFFFLNRYLPRYWRRRLLIFTKYKFTLQIEYALENIVIRFRRMVRTYVDSCKS